MLANRHLTIKLSSDWFGIMDSSPSGCGS